MLHYNTFNEYQKMPGINFSSLKLLMTHSPRYLKWALDSGEDKTTPARELGSLVHALVLEPEKFESNYAVYDGVRRGKSWDEFSSNNTEKTIVKHDAFLAAAKTASAVLDQYGGVINHPAAHREVSVSWKDVETYLECRGRIDILSPEGLIDIKTTRRTNSDDFVRDVFSNLYYAQMAFYYQGMLAATETPRPAFILGVSTEPPHDVFRVNIGGDVMAAGMRWCKHAMDRYATCAANGHWPGPAPVDAELPNWMQ